MPYDDVKLVLFKVHEDSNGQIPLVKFYKLLIALQSIEKSHADQRVTLRNYEGVFQICTNGDNRKSYRCSSETFPDSLFQ